MSFVSGIESPNDIDPLDYASAEALPDPIVATIVDHNDLILFGTQVSEIWTQRGGVFPFLRLGNGVLEYGCIAKHSPAKIDNSVCWLAHDKTVRVLRENVPTRISTEGVEYEISNYSRVDDAIGFSMTVDGRTTYTLTFPTALKTWQYSFNTGLWNEQESFGLGRWRVDGALAAYGKTLVWDNTTNRIGEMDTDVNDEWGDQIVWKIVSAPVHNGNKWLFHNSIYLDFEMGVETQTDASTGADRDALVMIRWSNDGKNWGPIYQRSLGAIGNYSDRISINQNLGRAKNRIYELSISDPVKRHFIGAEGEIQVGSN
jgi:hypothetical protein